MKKTSGFTLIEILVVMVIFGVMASVVLFSSQRQNPPPIEKFNQLFIQKFNNTVEKSVATQQQFALECHKTHFNLLTYATDGWQLITSKNQPKQSNDTNNQAVSLDDSKTVETAKQTLTEQESSNPELQNAWLKIPENDDFSLYVDGVLVLCDEKIWRPVDLSAAVEINPKNNQEEKRLYTPHIKIASNLEITSFEMKLLVVNAYHTFKSDTVGNITYENSDKTND